MENDFVVMAESKKKSIRHDIMINAHDDSTFCLISSAVNLASCGRYTDVEVSNVLYDLLFDMDRLKLK